MSRPVAIRVSYRSDAAFLLRLGEAIGKDEKQSELWRKQAKELALKLTRKLLSADEVRVPCVVVPVRDVRRRR